MQRRRPRLRVALAAALVGAAVVRELRKPADERTWEGRLAGVLPYDLRPPTPARFRSRVWNPDDERLIVPQVFGIGWTLNLGRLFRLVRGQQ
jgi:hypothetical protein